MTKSLAGQGVSILSQCSDCALQEDSTGRVSRARERGSSWQSHHPRGCPLFKENECKVLISLRAVQAPGAHGRVNFVSVWGCTCSCDFLRRAALHTFLSRSPQVLGADRPGAGLECLRIMLPSPDFSEQNSEERMRETAILFVLVNLAVIGYTI